MGWCRTESNEMVWDGESEPPVVASPDKVGSSWSRPRRGAGVAVRWGGRLHGGRRQKASSVLPPTQEVEIVRLLIFWVVDFVFLSNFLPQM